MAYWVDPSYWGAVLVLIGGLLPDVDHPNTTIGKLNPLNRTKKKRRQRVQFHRGKPHTLLGAALLSAPALIAGPKAFGLVYAGAVAHITADYALSRARGYRFSIKIW